MEEEGGGEYRHHHFRISNGRREMVVWASSFSPSFGVAQWPIKKEEEEEGSPMGVGRPMAFGVRRRKAFFLDSVLFQGFNLNGKAGGFSKRCGDVSIFAEKSI